MYVHQGKNNNDSVHVLLLFGVRYVLLFFGVRYVLLFSGVRYVLLFFGVRYVLLFSGVRYVLLFSGVRYVLLFSGVRYVLLFSGVLFVQLFMTSVKAAKVSLSLMLLDYYSVRYQLILHCERGLILIKGVEKGKSEGRRWGRGNG
ncbi:hypothetical protein Pmani_038850 [Petrolisthes manimaculis]|uniref:Uncharacterized protein n=1 Tax=Petrolisthes manimaculis TaxID=1843537 RepID=A0AAE1NFA3_9EUCA|nr:hypothetical protein Pmani_038850 [Petrolisthes manimaculis]